MGFSEPPPLPFVITFSTERDQKLPFSDPASPIHYCVFTKGGGCDYVLHGWSLRRCFFMILNNLVRFTTNGFCKNWREYSIEEIFRILLCSFGMNYLEFQGLVKRLHWVKIFSEGVYFSSTCFFRISGILMHENRNAQEPMN